MYRLGLVGIIARFAISLVAVVVIQGILAFRFRVFSYFDLPLIFSVYYGFTMGKPVASTFIGSGLGLMQDSLSGAAMGMNGFTKTLIGFLAASAGAKFNVDYPITRFFALFLFTVGDGLLVTMLGLLVGSNPGALYGGTLMSWLLTAVFNTLLGLAMFGYYDRTSDATAS